MKNTAYRLAILFVLMCLTLGGHAQDLAELQEPVMIYEGKIKVTPKELRQRRKDLNIQMIVEPNRSSVSSNQAVRLLPLLVSESGRKMQLAPMQINGRNEQRAYLRSEVLARNDISTDNTMVERVGRRMDYKQKVRFKPWMVDAHIDVMVEIRGCGGDWEPVQTERLEIAISLQKEIPPYQMDFLFSYLLSSFEAKGRGQEWGAMGRYIYETEDRAATIALAEIYKNALKYPRKSKMFCDLLISAAHVYRKNPVANFNAASAALALGDLSAAHKFLQKVDRSWPEYANVVGIYEALRGNYDAARKQFNRALEAGVMEAAHNLEELQKKLDNIEAIRLENER